MPPAPAAVRQVPVSPATLRPGDLVGQYEVVERIGAGGMAHVYKVRRGDGVYALKILEECCFDDAMASDAQREGRVRAQREFLAITVLEHPNILRGYEFGLWPEVSRGWPYIVTEFVDGAQVHRWRAEEQPSLRRICRVLAKTSDALAHIHRAGLVHRDVKSENILVRRGTDEPVLIDLGIARHGALRPVTMRAEIIGTRTHYAPEYVEQMDSRALGARFEWTPRVDLYAFGCVAYELLTGRPPVLPDGDEDLAWAAIREEPVPDARTLNPAIPEVLSRLVMSLLEKKPANRPENADEVRAALEEVLAKGGPELDASFPVPRAPATREVPTQGSDMIRALVSGRLRGEGLARESPEESGEDGHGDDPAGDPLSAADPDGEAEGYVDLDDRDGPALAGDPPPAKKADAFARALRKVQEELDGSGSLRGHLRQVIVIGAGVVGCVLVAVVAMAGGNKTAGKDDLLARFEQEQRAASRDGGVTAAGRAESAPMAAAPVPRVAVPDARPPTGSDARDIDAAIAQRFGRPTVPPGGVPEMAGGGPESPQSVPAGGKSRADGGSPKVVQAVVDDDPLVHAEVVEASAAASPADGGPRKLGIAMGTHIRVRLVSNLDSRTIAAGPAEAVLPLPFMLHGSVVLPARTMLYGRASENGGRFNVQFTHLRLPDDTEIGFEGLALDRGDNKPGLAASARIVPNGGSGDEGLGTKIARGTGNVLLNTVTGGVAEDVGRGAGSAIVNHRSNNSASGAEGSAILLDSGVLFDVFVVRAF